MPMSRSDLKQLWSQRIKQWMTTTQSIVDWCRQHQVPYHQFIYWKGRILKKESDQFQELVDPPSDKSGISLEIKGVSIHTEQSFDENTLLKILQALGKL